MTRVVRETTRPYGVYGRQVSIGMTEADEKQVRAWAKKDAMTIAEFFAEMLGRERLRRAGITVSIITDQDAYFKVMSKVNHGR